ncbi:unnamed protein product, partial [Choristocarpus tenellus]
MTGTENDVGLRAGKLTLDGVKNIRDLSSVTGSGIHAGRVFRTGNLSQATEADITRLKEEMYIRTLIDLRSRTETMMDKQLHSHVYRDYVDVELNLRGRTSGEKAAWVWPGGRGVGGGGGNRSVIQEDSRRRYFVSLIDESIYKKGIFQKLRKRHKAAVVALAPAAPLSKRCMKKAKGYFMAKINDGGLVLLNEV